MNLLQGKKTYIVAASVVVSAIFSFLTGAVDLQTAIVTALQGVGLATLRAGVTSEASKP